MGWGEDVASSFPAGKWEIADRELEVVMAVREFTEALPPEDNAVESSWDHAIECWAPPLAATGTPVSRDILRRVPLGQDALRPVTRDEPALDAPEQKVVPPA